MALENPVFKNSAAFNPAAIKAADSAFNQQGNYTADQLEEIYQRPSATSLETDRMSYDDTIVKTLSIFALVLVGAVIGWFVPALAIVGAIAGLVLAMVNIFKKKVSPALILAYGFAEGIFLGGLTSVLESAYSGIAIQALLGTLSVFGVVLALFSSGKVRATPRLTKIFMVAIIGYAVFSLINLGLMIFGVTTDPWGLRGMQLEIFGFGIPLGALLGVVAILLAAYSLVMDFENIKTGVEQGAPRVFGWKAAFGLAVTLIWLYVEILRLIAILRGND